MSTTYMPTRYLSHATEEDGSLILHNSRTGALGVVPPGLAHAVRAALRRSARHPGPLDGILHDLQEGGFLIPEGTDEQALVHQSYLSKYDDTYLNLIIMPTEQCNFRCTYCYESFLLPEMSTGVQEGIRRYVANQRTLEHLEINWFGGEPLLAPTVVRELSRYFFWHCRERGIRLTASMTTNGSLLTPEVADEIIAHEVRHFQITVDGVKHDHDQRRARLGGGGTFDDILRNLRYLHSTEHSFTVTLRHNFDPESVDRIPQFIALLKQEFEGDPRFRPAFEPIGKWGGPNDADLSVCDERSAMRARVRAQQLSLEAGLRSGIQVENLGPNTFVCYAANPRSFVIGSDGRLYKCTVELAYHDRNIVGRLHPDGTMELDWRKMALWCETNGLDGGKKCGACFFRPACHGAVCPKQWMDANDCTCPPERVTIREILPLAAKEGRNPSPLELPIATQCGRG